MGFVKDIADTVTGKGAAKEAEKASKTSRDLTKVQAELLKMNIPFLQQLLKTGTPMIGEIAKHAQDAMARADQYDPSQESARAMLAFDEASKHSLESDLGNVNSGYTARGFSAGNGSSDQNGMNQDVLARRSFNRGAFAANLHEGEFAKKSAAYTDANNEAARAFGLLDPTGRTTQTAGGLGSASASMQNISQGYANQAASANPGALVPIVSDAIKGIKFPWEKKKPEWKGIPYL